MVNTNGANISLKAITFDNANGHYAIYQTNGSSFISLVGSGTSASAINVVAGNHAIHADITMNSSMGVDIGANSSLTFYNPLSGGSSFSLTKTGAGTLFMNAFNTYSGDTVVVSGTLSGAGALAGLVSVQNGATLAVGDGSDPFGVLTVGSLALLAGSHTVMEITGTSGSLYDQIVGTGSGGLTFGGSLDLVMSGSYADQTTFHLFSNFASSGGDFAAVGLDATGDLVVVPEPSTCAIALAGLACGGWRMLRRRRLRQAHALAA